MPIAFRLAPLFVLAACGAGRPSVVAAPVARASSSEWIIQLQRETRARFDAALAPP